MIGKTKRSCGENKLKCGNFFHGGTELPNVMFMYMQYAGWRARMDGRRIERARARIEEGRERGVGGGGGGSRRRTTNNNNIYKPIIINTINQHHFFHKPSKI